MTQKKILGEWVTLPKHHKRFYTLLKYLDEVFDWVVTVIIGVLYIGGLIYIMCTW